MSAAPVPASELPDVLPANPQGWTKTLNMHLNFGSKGGAASYRVKDDQGRVMPIAYAYDTRKPDPYRGFLIGEGREALTWAQLVEAWPAFVAELRAKDAKP